jgi:hypothetical protein
MFARSFVAAFLFFQFTPMVSQTQLTYQAVAQLPQGPISRVPSPDGKWILVFECPNNCSERRLSIEDSESHTQRLVGRYERSLSVSWSPDGQSFFVDDSYGSNGADSYVYDPITLKTIDLADPLAASDPHAAQFLRAGHSYLVAKRWLNSRELLVVLFGHFDELPARSFNLRYRVGLDGSVRRISQRPTNPKG